MPHLRPRHTQHKDHDCNTCGTLMATAAPCCACKDHNCDPMCHTCDHNTWHKDWDRDPMCCTCHHNTQGAKTATATHMAHCYGAAPILDSVRCKNELRDLVLRIERRGEGRHTGLTEG